MLKTADSQNYLNLSIPERVLLVEDIWDSIVDESDDLPLTAPQKDELEQRLLDHKKNSQNNIQWDELKKYVFSKLTANA